MNKEIEEKVDNIIDYIKNSNNYKNYLKAKEILNTREDLKELIEDIKRIQKEIIRNPNKKEELEIKLKKKIELLENDITYNEYNNYLSEVNNMLAIFENKINKYFDDVFN